MVDGWRALHYEPTTLELKIGINYGLHQGGAVHLHFLTEADDITEYNGQGRDLNLEDLVSLAKRIECREFSSLCVLKSRPIFNCIITVLYLVEVVVVLIRVHTLHLWVSQSGHLRLGLLGLLHGVFCLLRYPGA